MPLDCEHWFKLPLALRQRWWRETSYGRLAPSAELLVAMHREPDLFGGMMTIEEFHERLAELLQAARDLDPAELLVQLDAAADVQRGELIRRQIRECLP